MQKQTRRSFIASALTLTATAGVAASAKSIMPMETKEKKQLVHHVFFWLKNPGSKEDLRKLLAGLQTLKKIETVKSMHIGIPAETEHRPVVDASYSASELMFFDDVEGQKVYQDHPIHQRFIEDCSELWERVVVYDAQDI